MSFECRSDITSAAAMATAARSFFESRDADGDGRIGVDELTGVLSDLGLKQRGETDVDFKALVVSAMREHDTSLDRTLSFGEFASMYSRITGVALPDDRLEVPAACPAMGGGDHLPKKSFTKGVPSRDPNTGGITTSPDMDFSFDPGPVLGKGGFAVVKKATHKRTRVEYAVKIINVTSQPLGDDAMTLEEIAEEVRLTMSFSNVVNANVVKVFDFYVSPGNVYVVMELLTGGSLLDALTIEGCFSERKAAAVLHKLFTGLELIHGDAMAHRDLKLENLVFASKSFEKNPVNPRHQKKVVDLETLRIADFGLARKFVSARHRLTARCGTPQYVAPEIVNGEPYTPAVDMWACGVILYATVLGELPFDHRDQASSFRLIKAGAFHSPSKRVSPELDDLLRKLLQVDKVKRFTAAEALEHPFFCKNDAGGPSDSFSLKKNSLASFNASLAKHGHSPGARVVRAAAKLGDELPTLRIKKGEFLIRKGNVCDEIYLIKKGTVAVEVVVNGETVVVATRGVDEFVGEMGADIGGETAKIVEDSEVETVFTSADLLQGTVGANVSPGARTSEINASFDGVTNFKSHKNHNSPTVWVSGKQKINKVTLSQPHTGSKKEPSRRERNLRVADVRALQDVTVAVMNASQMRWLLEHDYGADSELTSAVTARRAELERATSQGIEPLGKEEDSKTRVSFAEHRNRAYSPY